MARNYDQGGCRSASGVHSGISSMCLVTLLLAASQLGLLLLASARAFDQIAEYVGNEMRAAPNLQVLALPTVAAALCVPVVASLGVVLQSPARQAWATLSRIFSLGFSCTERWGGDHGDSMHPLTPEERVVRSRWARAADGSDEHLTSAEV